jgi:hypothetical protein
MIYRMNHPRFSEPFRITQELFCLFIPPTQGILAVARSAKQPCHPHSEYVSESLTYSDSLLESVVGPASESEVAGYARTIGSATGPAVAAGLGLRAGACTIGSADAGGDGMSGTSSESE